MASTAIDTGAAGRTVAAVIDFGHEKTGPK
jgi:hypothetical protein